METWLGQWMAFRRTRLSSGGGFTGNVGRKLGLLTGGGFAAPLWRMCHHPYLPFSYGRRIWLGGNCGIQKYDFVDPLTLVIKCLEGEGHESGDLVVLMINKRPFPPETKSTHIMLILCMAVPRE